MKYQISKEDIEFRAQFESLEFPVSDFDHNAQLRLAYIYLADHSLSLPFGLKFENNYKDCCRVLNSNADFSHKYIEESKLWLMNNESGMKYILAINFDDENFNEIDHVVVIKFIEEDVEKLYLENKI